MTVYKAAQAANDVGLSTKAQPGSLDTPDQVSLRQLRHHSKNALQRLLWQVTSCQGLQAEPAGRALMQELERRILLSATLSDALFGFVQPPSSVACRLESLARASVDLMADTDQTIGVTVDVTGDVPEAMSDLLVRVAHELVGNAVKHGMHVRMIGEIELRVRAGPGVVTMTVADDGWGMGDCLHRGEGLHIAHLLAAQHEGDLTLTREPGRTLATLRIPRSAMERRA